MRKSFAFLISSIAVAGMMTGCAQHAGAPMPENVDVQAAKKLKMPIVIYNVGVKYDETKGTSRPVVYFVNTSSTPVSLATFYVSGKTSDGKSVTLWADDYEKVAPGKTSQNGVLGAQWNSMKVECVEIKEAGLQINGKNHRFSEGNINQLFLDPSINVCK
jgi:hypothetical protein